MSQGSGAAPFDDRWLSGAAVDAARWPLTRCSADYRSPLVAFRTPVPSSRRWSRAAPLALLATFLGAFIGLLFVAGSASPAHAENSLDESVPESGGEVSTSLAEIVLTFENDLAGQPLVSVVCDPAGTETGGNPFTNLGTPAISGKTVTVPLTAALPEGSCSVVWQTFDSSGQQDATDNFSFDVSAGAAADGATATAEDTSSGSASSGSDIESASGQSNGPIWLGRLLSIIGISVVFGSLVLIVAAWPEGPEYVLALKFLRTMWFVGIGGTLLYVVGLSAAINGDSFGSGLSPGAWFDLMDAGWGGRAALMRIVFVAASGWVVLRPERAIDPTTNMLALGIPGLAVVTLGLTNTGGSLAFLGVIASIAHVLAMAVWFGGVVLLARVVLAGPGEEDLVHAVHGFGRISNPAIVITVVSGLIQLYRLDGGELFSTGHGRVLMLKTVAAAGMIFVGLTARQIARVRLARASELNVRVADRMRRAFGTEAAIGLVVLMLTGWMMSFQPSKGGGDGGGGGDWAIEVPAMRDQATGLDVELFLDPGRASATGLNQLRVEVNAPAEGISDFRVIFTSPDGATVIDQPIAITGAQTAEFVNGGGIPFTVAGTWTVQVTANTPTGTAQPTNQITIANEDGTQPEANVDIPALPATTSVVPDGPQLTDPPPTVPETTEG